MCKLCDSYNFGSVGFDWKKGYREPTIYFPCMLGNVPDDEKFRFCPACGKELTEENFKKQEERNNEQDVE